MHSRGELPHLEKPGATYFVTFCTVGSNDRPDVLARPIPCEACAIATASEPTTSHRPRPRLLARPDTAGVVQQALLHFHQQRYWLWAWVVMPDHVHVLMTTFSDHRLGSILHSWKSYTANVINRVLSRRGRVWQRESFDHLVRSSHHATAFVTYIELNPVAAKLCRTPEAWPYSSARTNLGSGVGLG